MHLVLDACVALDWYLPSEAGASYSQPLAKTTASGNARFHVPVHFDVEVCGQLLKSHRRKPDTFSKKWLDTSLETLDMLPMVSRDGGIISACKAWNVRHWTPG